MVTLLDPKNDYVFKRLFADNPNLAVALINDLRPDLPQVIGVEILNPVIDPSELTSKGIVLDVRAQCIDGHMYNIEMQVRRDSDWSSRSLYYLARLLSQQLAAGEDYGALNRAIAIHLLDFDLFTATAGEQAQALWRFEMRDPQQPDVVIGNELQLNIVELKKADRLGQLPDPTGAWVSFFEHWQEDSVMADIRHEPVKQAMNRIRQLSAEEEAQRLAFVRERGLRDWNHSIRSARREGREEGREEGYATGRTQALRDTLGMMLSQRFGPLTESIEAQVAAAGPEQLVHWISRVMATDSLDEVLNSSPDN